MKKNIFNLVLSCFFYSSLIAQSPGAKSPITPQKLWELGRVSAMGISLDQQHIVYKVSHPDIQANGFTSKYYLLHRETGKTTEIPQALPYLKNKDISADSSYTLYTQRVKLQATLASDLYPQLQKADAYVYNELDYRHWDTWEDGSYNHLFVKHLKNPTNADIDLLEGQKFHCPQKPFGGSEDYTWHPQLNQVVYVSKKLSGTAYALSTNTDLYLYDIVTQTTQNLTEGMKGYDTEPAFSSKGVLAWLSMERDGFEADKNNLYILENGNRINLTADWDGTVEHFMWSPDGSKIYFIAPKGGTMQLFEVELRGNKKQFKGVKQLTAGHFDITSIIGIVGNVCYVTRTDMNTAAEIYSYDIRTTLLKKLSRVNDAQYENISKCEVRKRMVKTTDNLDMTVWVIYPPDFDSTKTYPTLLYCQGGPQSALSQFYSFRWNFQLMASKGYIVVAPNRRGMPGHGKQWNEQISKDWGGQVMQDYLSAIDDVSKEKYVDKKRLGAIGASYGGYSVFYLAGIHNNRFKTFISHCGVFNLQSMYGTTEEVFFTNFDLGGAYWETNNSDAQKAYGVFNPINRVDKWNTPILIIQGGKDYRVPIGQGQEAFQAAQLLGIKSRFLYFPEENHWVLAPQNALVWQSEFFKWLEETL